MILHNRVARKFVWAGMAGLFFFNGYVTGRAAPAPTNPPPAGVPAPLGAAVEQLKAYLSTPADQRPELSGQSFAKTPLSPEDARAAARLLWDDHVARIRQSRAEEVANRRVRTGEFEMPFFYRIFGDKPAGGRSLFISMHGGGNAPRAVNDQQWENQKHLYRPEEGVYLAPRAPTDAWNLWHQDHIDVLFSRIVEDLIVFENVNPNRVYIMGYSAGGDGVYQLAPRMADQLAAAAMMAGHPNGVSVVGLRNLPFAIHVGALDSGFDRNKVAAEWGRKLDELQKADPEGYVHVVRIHPNQSHWMNREDAEAVPWMATFTRDPLPMRVVWRQSGAIHTRFYWLAVPTGQTNGVNEIVATRKGQEIDVQADLPGPLRIRLNDRMMDLGRPVVIRCGGQELFRGVAPRTIATIARTLEERGDPASVFSAEIEVKLPGVKPPPPARS